MLVETEGEVEGEWEGEAAYEGLELVFKCEELEQKGMEVKKETLVDKLPMHLLSPVLPMLPGIQVVPIILFPPCF